MKRFPTLILLILITLTLNVSFKAAGEVDATFKASAYAPNNYNNGTYQTNGTVLTTVALPDGKILVGGQFTVAGGIARNGVARLNADGSLDTTFNPPDLFARGGNANALIQAIGIQSDGSIILGGLFGVINTEYTDLIRLNPDGSLDSSFNQTSTNGNFINRILIKPNDSIIVFACNVTQYDRNGFLVRNFESSGNCSYSVAAQQDEKVLVASQSALRYNNDGSLDSSFTIARASGLIRKIIVQPDGKILIAGDFSTVNGFAQNEIARLNADGTLDRSFNANGTGASGSVYDLILEVDNKILIFGSFWTFNGVNQRFIARLNSDGTLDASFNSPFTGSSITGLKFANVLSDGKILLTDSADNLLRLNSDGTIDNTFNAAALQFGGTVVDIVQQPDGKIIAGGSFTMANGIMRNSIARYNIDGSFDESFMRVDYFPNTNFYVRKIMLQPDGKILVFAGGNILLRLNSDGTRANSFTFNGYVEDFAVQPDGKIIVNGNTRLLPDGAIDNTFDSPSVSGVKITVIQPDGKILIGGIFGQVNGVARSGIARLNADGTLDYTFNPPYGIQGGELGAIALGPDGKILLGGAFTSVNGVPRKSFARLNGDGSLDTDFNPDFGSTQLAPFTVQADGKILIGMDISSGSGNGISSRKIARLNSDGTIDASFIISSGANSYINKIIIQSDGKILLGGGFTRINGISAVGIARLLVQTTKSRKRVRFF